jgi:hypothetical protein
MSRLDLNAVNQSIADFEVKKLFSKFLQEGLSFDVESAGNGASSSFESLVVETTLTEAGAVGGRARFELDANVALGGWANALKAQFEIGASGKVTGLGSAFVAELIMSAGCVDGSYAPLEVELGMPENAVTGTRTSLMSLNVYGHATGKGEFDDNGFLFDLNGVTGSDAGHMFDEVTEQAVNAQARLRVQINGTTWYIPLCDTAALS